ncbi:hypothetical protein N44_00203 [Microcystis aeruginosa NIES-44]|uniref:Uncharacterized protein n=1 Tax=Microcystis aeruginosa NIES-44 TaxID=449439 RepID=A0A0A1VQC3_MICAE|nr:hypothetical protein N44_00203 [Microcystis aeruginosa NIES-44]
MIIVIILTKILSPDKIVPLSYLTYFEDLEIFCDFIAYIRQYY